MSEDYNERKAPLINEVVNIPKSAPSFLYTFDTGAMIDSETGAWRAVRPEDLGAEIKSISITGIETLILDVDEVESLIQTGNNYLKGISGQLDELVNGATYQPNFHILTNGQYQIPAGVRSWSVGIESGSASINGAMINAQMSLGGGDYDGRQKLANLINIGTTGGRVVIFFEN